MTTQERILYIIKRLSQDACSSKQLTFEVFETNKESKRRIIQNDIKLLKTHYPQELISLDKGLYKFLTPPAFLQNIMRSDGINIKNLLEFIMLFDSKMLLEFEKDEPKLISKFKKEVKTLYKIEEIPFEILKSPFLEEIKRAIKRRLYATIEYQQNELLILKNIKIHRIVYAKGNWYIVVYNSNNGAFNPLQFLRINFVKNITLDSKTFQRDTQIEHFIENFQSLFSKYNEERFEVVIEVDKRIMRHFEFKKHLKSQEIIEKNNNSMVLKYSVNSELEILPLIKQWIPLITIISPDWLRKRLKKDITKLLKQL